MTDKAIVKKDPGDLSPELANELAGMAGAGLEGIKKEDLLMPRVTILQALSPQCNERKSEYVEGAKPGLIINTATNSLFTEIKFLPVAYQRRHIEWKLKRGGLVKDWGTDDSVLDTCEPMVDEKGRQYNRTPQGNELVVAGTWYGLNLSENLAQCFIAMFSTQMKASKRWTTMATSEKIPGPNGTEIVPPLLYRSYLLSTVPQTNDQGDWFGWNIKRDVNIQQLVQAKGRQILVDARNLFQAVSEGAVVARAEAFGEEREHEQDEKF